MNPGYWKGKVIAVTGGRGFLGSHFVKALKIYKAIVVSPSREEVDLTNLYATSRLLRGVDVVINCAAIDGNTEFKKKHPAQILETNIRITSNILNAAKKRNVKDVILISSAEIYSNDAPNPITEDDDFRRYNGHVDNGYVLSKRIGEILAELYQKEFGLKIYLPRPSNIYGPGDDFGEESNRVIPSFIRKVANDLPIEIWGDGLQIRQFIYVEDVVRSVLAMAKEGRGGKLNISTNEFISVVDLAKKIYQIYGKKPNIVLDSTKAVGVKNRILDITNLHSVINFTLSSLDLGLRKTVKWYARQ